MDLTFYTLPPKTDLTQEEMTDLYRTQFKFIELLENAAVESEFSAKNVKINSTILIGLVYGEAKLYLNKGILPEYWEDITQKKN